MSPDVIALGPYDEAVVDHLPYDLRTYRRCKTRPGTKVLVNLFTDIHGSTLGRKMAQALGISDAWDFNQHQIDASKIDYDELKKLLDSYVSPGAYDDDIESLRVLSQAGFEMFFRPNY